MEYFRPTYDKLLGFLLVQDSAFFSEYLHRHIVSTGPRPAHSGEYNGRLGKRRRQS